MCLYLIITDIVAGSYGKGLYFSKFPSRASQHSKVCSCVDTVILCVQSVDKVERSINVK